MAVTRHPSWPIWACAAKRRHSLRPLTALTAAPSPPLLYGPYIFFVFFSLFCRIMHHMVHRSQVLNAYRPGIDAGMCHARGCIPSDPFCGRRKEKRKNKARPWTVTICMVHFIRLGRWSFFRSCVKSLLVLALLKVQPRLACASGGSLNGRSITGSSTSYVGLRGPMT